MPPRASSFDPFRTFKFRVRIGNATLAGVTKVSALGRTIAANDCKQGGDALAPRQSPGAVTYDDVTLEQGWSADASFEEWANAVARARIDPDEKNFKRTVFIDVFDLSNGVKPPSTPPSGQPPPITPVVSYKLHRCWVSKYVAAPELNAADGGVGIRSITLKHEGFERVT